MTDLSKNTHSYSVSLSFQKWWETRCNTPYEATMEKMQAWSAWEECESEVGKLREHIKHLAEEIIEPTQRKVAIFKKALHNIKNTSTNGGVYYELSNNALVLAEKQNESL